MAIALPQKVTGSSAADTAENVGRSWWGFPGVQTLSCCCTVACLGSVSLAPQPLLLSRSLDSPGAKNQTILPVYLLQNYVVGCPCRVSMAFSCVSFADVSRSLPGILVLWYPVRETGQTWAVEERCLMTECCLVGCCTRDRWSTSCSASA